MSDRMRVKITLAADEVEKDLLAGNTAVVIDTLRATSTIVTALNNGAKFVEPVVEIWEAQARGEELPEGSYLLCGERSGDKIVGFHLGNSPFDYSPEVVQNKILILSTSNGTRTIHRTIPADKILVGSLLNEEITMKEVIRLGKDLVLCCSGDNGDLSLEDFVTAGAMISTLLNQGIQIEGDDRIQTARSLYEKYADELVELISNSRNGKRLMRLGKIDEIIFCTDRNHCPIICYFDGAKIYTSLS